jgi:hypothetical protein
MTLIIALLLVVAFVTIIAVADSLDRRALVRLQAKTKPTARDLKRIAFLQTQVDLTPAKTLDQILKKTPEARRCSRSRHSHKN